MARPRSISDQQILDAARDVFIERGPNATTLEIAHRAGISEGTIFRRFATKEALFFRAMGLPEHPTWIESLDELTGQGDVRENLTRICGELLDFFRDMIPKIMLVISCSFAPHDVMSVDRDPLPVRGVRALTAWFDAERKLGRIRNSDPEILARCLIASMHHYVFAEVAGINTLLPFPQESFIRATVDMLWHGVAPDPA